MTHSRKPCYEVLRLDDPGDLWIWGNIAGFKVEAALACKRFAWLIAGGASTRDSSPVYSLPQFVRLAKSKCRHLLSITSAASPRPRRPAAQAALWQS